MRNFTAICFCLALAACQQTQDTASNAYNTAGEETGKSYNKIGELLGLKKPKPPNAPTTQNRYCYHTYNDIICYPHPLAGEEERMAGYQESNGKIGYLLQPTHVSDEGEKLSPPLKVVNVGAPPAVKGVDDKSQLKEIIFDPAELEPKELVPDKLQ